MNFNNGDEYGNLKRKGENFALCVISLLTNSCLTTPYQYRCISGKSLSMYEVVRTSDISRSRLAKRCIKGLPCRFPLR